MGLVTLRGLWHFWEQRLAVRNPIQATARIGNLETLEGRSLLSVSTLLSPVLNADIAGITGPVDSSSSGSSDSNLSHATGITIGQARASASLTANGSLKGDNTHGATSAAGSNSILATGLSAAEMMEFPRSNGQTNNVQVSSPVVITGPTENGSGESTENLPPSEIPTGTEIPPDIHPEIPPEPVKSNIPTPISNTGLPIDPGLVAILADMESEAPSHALLECKAEMKSNGPGISTNQDFDSFQIWVPNGNPMQTSGLTRLEMTDYMGSLAVTQKPQFNTALVSANFGEDSSIGMSDRAENLSTQNGIPANENAEDFSSPNSTLIQDLGPLDTTAPGEMLPQFLDPFVGLGEDMTTWLQGMRISPLLLGAAAGVLAVEIARRWQNRPSEELTLAAGCERVTLTWFPDSQAENGMGDPGLPLIS